ncbi:MAG TPA: hypothetical protein VKY37_06315 [Brumimicrobium sp.]|nr:hypothetical protein [Brumimicrobium sp.]
MKLLKNNLLFIMKKQLYYLFIGALMFTLLMGCKAKSTSELNSDVAKFVSASKEVISYGYIDFNAIKDKSELTKIPDLGSFINQQLSSIEGGVKLSDKIHFAIEGPLNKHGMPKNAYLFLSISNKDSLQKMFEEMGFFFEQENDLMVFYDMNMAVGFNENTVVMVSANFGDEPKDILMNAFKSFELSEKDERITEVLSQKTDVLIASHLENLYKTSNTSLENLSEEKQKELEKMVENGQLVFNLDFNKGDLTAKLDISKVNKKMKDAYFFKDKAANEITKNIGPGNPFIAMALSFDVEKLEDLMERFSPGSEKSFFSAFGPQGQMIESIVGEEVSDMMNGNIGLMVSSETSTKGSMGVENIPNINLYLGLGKNTSNMMDLLDTFSEEEMVQDLGDGYYKYDQSMMLVKDNAIIMHSNDTSKESFKVKPMETISEVKDFGNKPFTLFMDLKKLVDSDLNMTGGQYDVLIGLTDYLIITGDNDEIVLKLVLKNQKDNILKQVVNYYEEDLKRQAGNFSF